MVNSREISIIDGRHPVVEQSLPAGFFVPNSAFLGATEQNPEFSVLSSELETEQNSSFNPQNSPPDLIVLTGPNASGKSCYLRQVGLIQLMAQTGSFVPARSAVLGICDRIFTRVGAVDDLATGQSTFMVEMNETANILNHATPKSLVLLDEIGRGTATFDGLSIAWAVAEHLATEIRARTIFATHYHELNELASILLNVANYQVTVKELPDQIIFLHQVQPGGADRSYGIEAGRLAGLPASVIQRARQVMGQIEKHSRIAIGLRKGGKTEARPEKNGKSNSTLEPQPIEQLDIFGE
jgi:DNA mismatch repair protein MutS